MSFDQWTAAAGLLLTAALGFGPWMLAVHAKLAVIASQIGELCRRLEKLAAAHDQRLAMCIDHQARLDAQAVQVDSLAERLRGLERE